MMIVKQYGPKEAEIGSASEELASVCLDLETSCTQFSTLSLKAAISINST
jgi:hypothetical protein